MADLLPTLSSDEEENVVQEDDDEEEDDVELNISFGGVLGEDGGLATSLILSDYKQQGWSYQTALDNITDKLDGKTPARMDLASIIAAKRKSLKKQQQQKSVTRKDDDEKIEKQVDDKAKNTEGIASESDQKDDDKGDSESDSDDNSSSSSSDEGKGEKKKSSGESSSSRDSSDSDDSDDDDDSSEDEQDEVDDADHKMEDDILKTRIGEEKQTQKLEGAESSSDEEGENTSEDASESEDGDDDEAQEEAKKAANFFDTQSAGQSTEEVDVFAQLTLSRPLLRGIATMGYVKPTAIQSAVIPVALAGRDICASAVTGSGKTAAFLLPILERVLYRSPGRIKALILTPTRELAAQCLGMLSTLSQFTKISSTLVVGGSKNLNAQMAELRARPQIVVATPGRLLDHLTNSAGVSLEDLEFLVLDEADRLLDLGFQDEVSELIRSCPIDRQTMLFSATMNTKVDDLIKLSLKRPIRVRISDKETKSSKDLEVAPRLEQEFVRVRSGNEGINREAMLLALLTRTFPTQTIVFFDTKAKAHRMMILCGLCGIKCAELHGNLTQTQRLEALEQFRKGEVDILLATDLAARGLDISRVDTVVNFEMPNQVETYIHRIGRTARAGRGGKSCTLIGEGRRHLMKDIMKDASEKKKSVGKDGLANVSQTAIIRSRSIPSAVIVYFVKKIQSLEEHVEEVLQAEAVARMDRLAEMEMTRAQNIIEHSDAIKARPQRQWFVSEKEKKMTKDAAAEKARLIAEKVGTGKHRMTRKKRRAREAREVLENQEDDEGEDNVKASQPKVPSIKKAAREYKKEKADQEMIMTTKSIYEEDMERASKKHKAGSAGDALGDSSLFSEEKIAFAPKKKFNEEAERAKSAYTFRGYDPLKDGKKKGKKKSHHKFKSKSKYKRR